MEFVGGAIFWLSNSCELLHLVQTHPRLCDIATKVPALIWKCLITIYGHVTRPLQNDAWSVRGVSGISVKSREEALSVKLGG